MRYPNRSLLQGVSDFFFGYDYFISPTDGWIAPARRMANRSLTESERERFIP